MICFTFIIICIKIRLDLFVLNTLLARDTKWFVCVGLVYTFEIQTSNLCIKKWNLQLSREKLRDLLVERIIYNGN